MKSFTAELVRILGAGMKSCEAIGMRCVLLGAPDLAVTSHAFDEAKDWQFHENLCLALTQDVPGAV